MRISDWSSDFCSSDLFDRTDWLEKLYEHCLSGYPPLFLRARAEGAEAWLFLYHKKPGEYHALANWYSFTFSPIFSANSEERTRLALLRAIARRLRGRATHISLRPVPDEIGRASCRARVCQYF